MRLCHVLTLFLVLCDGRPGLSRAQTLVRTAAEGKDITVKCLLFKSGTFKYFCRNNCDKTENILVETTANRKQNGRYSIKYEKRSSYYVMSVSIKNVSSSDSGTYSCETWSGSVKMDFDEFLIKVTSDPAVTPRLSLSYNGTTPQRSGPSSGRSSPSERVLLPVALTAVGIFISLTLFILYWRKRDNKPQEPPVSTEYAQTPQRDHEYEEISAENRAGPVEMSPASASFSKSLSSAPCGQLQTEDCSSNVTYSELDFTKSSSAPRSQTEAADVTVYSTVAVPQQ